MQAYVATIGEKILKNGDEILDLRGDKLPSWFFPGVKIIPNRSDLRQHSQKIFSCTT